MKIVIATPLYPPEIADPAIYIKEFIEHVKNNNKIVIVAYVSTEEDVNNKDIITISKRRSLIFRLIKYTIELFKASRGADVIYEQYSVAVGLPVLIVSRLRNIPVVIKFIGDEAWKRSAQSRLTKKYLKNFLEERDTKDLKITLIKGMQKFILRQAKVIITPSEYLRKLLIKAYCLQEKKVIINYDPTKKEESLPFETNRTSKQVLLIADEKDKIIKATDTINLLKKEFPDIKLIIPEKNITRAEMWYLYKTSQICILDLCEEDLQEATIECFAAGIPVVQINEIPNFLKDDKRREDILTSQKKALLEKFSWEAHMRELNNILESQVAKPGN